MSAWNKRGKWNIHSFDGREPYFERAPLAISRFATKLCEVAMKTSLKDERTIEITVQEQMDEGGADSPPSWRLHNIEIRVKNTRDTAWYARPDLVYASIARKLPTIGAGSAILLIIENDKGLDSGPVVITGSIGPAEKIDGTP